MKLIISVLSLAFFGFSCFSGNGKGKDLSSVALQGLIQKGEGYYLIDVRTSEEFASGHIPTAVNIPVDVIKEKIGIADKNAYIILYCRSGNRSGIAFKTLSAAGYKNLVNFGAISKFKGELVKP